MKRLVFISGENISEIVGSKLEPYWFHGNGFVVEYWNLTRIYYNESLQEAYFGGNDKHRYKFPHERTFGNKGEVEEALRESSHNSVFCVIDFNSLNDYWLRRLFKRYRTKYYVGPMRANIENTDPGSENVALTAKVIEAIISQTFLRKLNRKKNALIYRYTNFYKRPEFAIGSGTAGREQSLNITRAACFLSVPSVDVAWNTLPNLVNDDYCVFVDDAVEYSPDWAMMTGGSESSMSVDIESYYKNMRHLFDKIENSYMLKVVIATSGKFAYSDNKMFGGREIFYGKTNQLIQHSRFVIGHGSSGLWQAIINNKKIYCFVDPTFNNYKKSGVIEMAALLKVKPLTTTDIDNISFENVSSVNKDYYQELVDKYFIERSIVNGEKDAKLLIKEKLDQVFQEMPNQLQ